MVITPIAVNTMRLPPLPCFSYPMTNGLRSMPVTRIGAPDDHKRLAVADGSKQAVLVLCGGQERLQILRAFRGLAVLLRGADVGVGDGGQVLADLARLFVGDLLRAAATQTQPQQSARTVQAPLYSHAVAHPWDKEGGGRSRLLLPHRKRKEERSPNDLECIAAAVCVNKKRPGSRGETGPWLAFRRRLAAS